MKMPALQTASITLLWILLSSIATQAQTLAPPGRERTMERLNRYLDTLEARGFSGAVLVELDSSRIVSRGYGLRDRARGLTNTSTTVFDIGSITKQFTAAALLTLEMAGKLRVGDSLGMYFPNAPGDKAGITLHQLLRHESGLPSTIGRDYEKISASAFVDSVLRAPLLFTPGTRFGYSNIGYSLLAMIIEKVSGQPYEQYLYTNLWKPSGMESTGYRRPQFNPESIAVGYDRDGNVWGKPTEKPWDNDGPFWHLRGNGGILSTIEDLARWHHALLGDEILTPAARTKYYHPALRSTETTDSYYAYGWDVHRTPRNTLLLRHNGANGIFYADFARYIDDGVTIIALMNQMHPNFREVNAELARLIFDPAYMPPIPIADNAANRALTASLVALCIKQGADRGLEAYTRRARGEDLIEFRVNERGYDLLREKQYSQAIEVFRLNVFAFPESANAYDSLGEAYLSAGLTDCAIENYRKSVALDPGNMNAIEILKTLTRK